VSEKSSFFKYSNNVLGKLSQEEKKQAQEVFDKIPDIICDFITMSFDNVMNKYN